MRTWKLENLVNFPKVIKALLRGLNFDHKIKVSAHKRDIRIGKTPKN
jgi:hypothetical protein